jgi:branched-chain amino acid transport system substrate-binding protein
MGWSQEQAARPQQVRRLLSRRNFTIAGLAVLMAGCQVIPKAPQPLPAPTPTPEPSATALPVDQSRHRIALLVPLTGDTGAVGQAIANATTMALLDTNADNLRITTYDTAKGAGAAAQKAIADGNKLILGPLLADSVPAVIAAARPAKVPAISFSNDTSVAGADVLVMGHIPEQSIRRTVEYARARGSNSFAALLPQGDYGQRSLSALENALRDFGGTLVARESYARGNTSIISAAGRLRTRGNYDTVLIADGVRLSMQAATELQRGTATRARILGTDLWSGDSALTSGNSMNGALFSTVSDQRFKRFSDSYEARFGSRPVRVATLGYDAVLLTLRIARDWRVGREFPKGQLYDAGGFLGVDGAFRFGRNGVIERALEVREVRSGQVIEVDPAPDGFGN